MRLPPETLGKRADHLIFHNLENNTPVVTTRNDAQLEEAKCAWIKRRRNC